MAEQTITSAREVYVLSGRLAVGSMAEVFRARARSTGAAVVVKQLLTRFDDDDQLVKMFFDEARLGARLDHPNLLTTLDHGRDGSTHFMVFEEVDGPTLEALLPTLPPRERDGIVLHIIERIALALQALHTLVDDDGVSLEVLHRDVSPTNIIVGRDGVPRLIDLGIARMAAHARSCSTRPGVLKGRFAWMAPEQARALPLDGRCDVFALGLVLYQALAGRPPWGQPRSDLELLKRVAHATLQPVRDARADIPPALEAVLSRALAADRDERFASAADFARALDDTARKLGLERSGADVAAAVRRALDPTAADLGPLEDLEAVPPSRGTTR